VAGGSVVTGGCQGVKVGLGVRVNVGDGGGGGTTVGGTGVRLGGMAVNVNVGGGGGGGLGWQDWNTYTAHSTTRISITTAKQNLNLSFIATPLRKRYCSLVAEDRPY
jgi:hypothetical protein